MSSNTYTTVRAGDVERAGRRHRVIDLTELDEAVRLRPTPRPTPRPRGAAVLTPPRLLTLVPAPSVVRRPAISRSRLLGEAEQALQASARGRRTGTLAVIDIAEFPRLKTRLGAKVHRALVRVFSELCAEDAESSEQHSWRSLGGFMLLMPETDLDAARDRLRKLSRRVAATVVDVDGEHLRITPVIGFASFAGATSVHELVEQATAARGDAGHHLDLVPVAYSPQMASAPAPGASRSRLLAVADRLRSPLQIALSVSLLTMLPFIIYVTSWFFGFDLTTLAYPVVAVVLAGTALALWLESFQAVGAVEVPAGRTQPLPAASAIIAAYLPNEAATIADTITTFLAQDYPGELQVIVAYNTPQRLPVEETLRDMAMHDPRLVLVRVEGSTSKAQNVNAALAYVRGEFVGVFDADHHPAKGSFERAWQWLSHGHDVVQGHCVVRNGNASWVARMVAVEFETIYAVSHPGRARLHGFGIFGGSNGYWRTDSLRQIRMQRSMLTEDIDSSMRGLLDGFNIVSDPELISTELAPTTIKALWHQRMRWSQGWAQTSRRHLLRAVTSGSLNARQKVGAMFLLGWTQLVPWVTVQVVPILAFDAWRDRGFSRLDWTVPLFVLLSIFTFSVGPAQAIFAYALGNPQVRRHRRWFAMYALHSMLWFGELKNLICRVAQLKELCGERQWRVTPRAVDAPQAVTVTTAAGRTQARWVR